MDTTAQLALGGFLLAAALAVAAVMAFASGRAQNKDFLRRLSDEEAGREVPPGRRRAFAGVDRRLRGTRLGNRVQTGLAATGLDITPGEFTVYVGAVTAGLWLTAASVLAPFFGPIAAVLTLLAAGAFLSHQRQRRTEQFINQLPELSRILANATSAGLALRTALAMAADELEDPAGEELRLVTNELAVGRSVEEALNQLAERLPSRELVVLVTTLVLANRAGGTLVTSLRNLTDTLEERKETRREVRTMLAEVNATAFTVPVLGLGAMLMMNSMMPGALARVTGSGLGQVAIIAAVGLFAAGFFVIRRLGKIEI